MSELNTYFKFQYCLKAGPPHLALTGEELCAHMHPDVESYKHNILARARSGQSLSRWVLAGINFYGEDLRGFDLSYACLIGCNFDRTNLREANLFRANLEGASLRYADLEKANFEFAILGCADLSGARLIGANLQRSNLVGAIAEEADCSDAKFYYSRPGCANFSKAKFQRADITRAIFRKAILTGADLSEAQGTGNFDRADLTNAKQQ